MSVIDVKWNGEHDPTLAAQGEYDKDESWDGEYQVEVYLVG